MAISFGDFVSGFGDALGDAATGLIDGATQLVDTATSNLWNNLVMRVDDIVGDVLNLVWNIPKEISKFLLKMFKDPKFWMVVALGLGFISVASGLTAAGAAVDGMKWKAFLEGSGSIYHGWHLDFIVKTHRLAYLVSPQYREDFQESLGELPNNMIEAGIDIQYATQLFASTMSLVDSFGAMVGKDWDVSQAEGVKALEQFGEVTGETLQEWGQNPNLMIEWVDENLIAPAHNESAQFMNRLSEGLTNVIETADTAVSNIRNFRTGLGRVARDYDRLYNTNLVKQLEEGLIGFDEIIYIQWDETRKQLEGISNILQVRIAEEREHADFISRIREKAAGAFVTTWSRDIQRLKSYNNQKENK